MTPISTQKSPGRLAPSIAAAVLILLLPAPASGQATAPAATPPPTADTEPIALPEFRVDSTRDVGYLASNATSGTRLNMSIRELPMQLEVITREFMEDVGAVNFKEALEYSSGVSQDIVQSSNNFLFSPSGTGQQTGVLRPDGTALNIRGYNTRFTLRNGFRTDYVTDVINIGRQELVRGPQALLYGVAALGGIVNIDPRYPMGRRQQQVRLGFGSNDFRRAELYISDQVSRRGSGYLNYGFGLVSQQTSDYTDFNDRKLLLATPTIDWRISEKVNVLIDAEIGTIKSSGTGFQDLNDASPGAIINEFGLAANNTNVYGETVQVARDRFGKDRKFRWSGPDSFQEQDYINVTAQVNWKVSDRLQFLAGVNATNIDQTTRSLDSQGSVLQASATRPTAAGPWADTGANPLNATQRLWKYVNWQWAMPVLAKEVRQERLEANYTFELFGGRQSILAGWQNSEVWQSDTSTAQVTRNDGTDGNRSWVAFESPTPIRYAGEQVRPFRDSQFSEWSSGFYGVYNGRFWGDRINTIFGYRRDRYMVRTLNWTYGKADTTLPDSNVANWRRPAGYDDIAGFTSTGSAILNNPGASTGTAANSVAGAVPLKDGYRFGGKVQYEDSPNAGVSLRVTRNINVFAMSGRGVFPNTGQRDGQGSPFEAERTKGTDVGIKADLWKDDRGTPRISLQLGGYKIDRENAIYNVFWAPQPRSNNQATLRSGMTGSVLRSGTGPNAYAVMNSGFTTFQTSQPVTYLLPTSYIPAADLTHPRVLGAPQLNNFILVDYATLGTSAADPLRRAMDAAATDTANRTALQTANTGSGATGLYANNAYINRNSDVAYNDRARGVDLSVVFNLTESYTSTLTYSYLKQEVTGGFKIVDQPNSTEYDSWWNYMNIPLDVRRANVDESSYDWSATANGARTVDVPEQQVSMWNKYTFRAGRLKGLDVGLGLSWRGERQSEVTLTNAAQTTRDGRENVRFKPFFSDDTKVNMALGYRARIGDRSWRFQLNVNNLLDDQKDEVFGTSVLYINPATGGTVASTTAGARMITVPERARIYFQPRSFRFTATVSF